MTILPKLLRDAASLNAMLWGEKVDVARPEPIICVEG